MARTTLTRTHGRLLVCTLLAVVAGHYAQFQAIVRPGHPDTGQIWFAAKAVLRGQNPYALIGPGLTFEWPAPLFYPLPAALLGLPLAPLSEPHATFVFMALGIGLFAWALTEHGWWPLLALASVSVQQALMIAQWSPLFAGAVVLAPVGIALVAKPTIGAAVFAARPSWWGLGSAVVLTVLAFALQPTWVQSWREALHVATATGTKFPYRAPISFPGGVLALLALLRWRRPEARLVAVLACVPQTTLPYEATLLFLIPRGWKQSGALAALSWVMVLFVKRFYVPVGLTQTIDAYGPTMVLFLYLPCTLMVLRRPNEGTVPAWLERRVPGWARTDPQRAQTSVAQHD